MFFSMAFVVMTLWHEDAKVAHGNYVQYRLVLKARGDVSDCFFCVVLGLHVLLLCERKARHVPFCVYRHLLPIVSKHLWKSSVLAVVKASCASAQSHLLFAVSLFSFIGFEACSAQMERTSGPHSF